MRSGLLAIVLCLAGCAKEEPATEAGAAEVAASIGDAGEETFEETVDATGLVTARPGRVATLAAPAAARVANVFVAPGSLVHAGDPLIEFEQAPFEAARKSAESALLAAEHAADRSQRLADAGVLPRKEAEAAAAELANARLNATNARRASELATLHAPFGGTVTRMTTTLGATVDPTQPLVEVTDTAELDVILTLSPADAARTHSGNPVSLYTGAAAVGEPEATGTVVAVAAMVDSGGVAARVGVTNTRRPLRLAEPVFGRIVVARHPAAVTVPLESLVPTGEGFKVFVVDSNGIAHETPVTVGGRSDTRAWITDGLRPRDRVVTRGAYGVEDSARVATTAKP
jgi:RND family efflux transporter MFP subunit